MAIAGGLIEWACAVAPLPGEAITGDRCVVTETPRGVLLAVADGLGHGPDAAHASAIAIAAIDSHPDQPIVELVRLCHLRLNRTRGVVMSIALIDHDRTLAWLGVGNVEAVLVRADPSISPPVEFLTVRGGVVGHVLPSLLPERLHIAVGDTLCMATDGVRPDFYEYIALRDPPSQAAEAVLHRYATGTDDALVLVARCIPDQA